MELQKLDREIEELFSESQAHSTPRFFPSPATKRLLPLPDCLRRSALVRSGGSSTRRSNGALAVAAKLCSGGCGGKPRLSRLPPVPGRPSHVESPESSEDEPAMTSGTFTSSEVRDKTMLGQVFEDPFWDPTAPEECAPPEPSAAAFRLRRREGEVENRHPRNEVDLKLPIHNKASIVLSPSTSSESSSAAGGRRLPSPPAPLTANTICKKAVPTFQPAAQPMPPTANLQVPVAEQLPMMTPSEAAHTAASPQNTEYFGVSDWQLKFLPSPRAFSLQGSSEVNVNDCDGDSQFGLADWQLEQVVEHSRGGDATVWRLHAQRVVEAACAMSARYKRRTLLRELLQAWRQHCLLLEKTNSSVPTSNAS